MPLIVAFPSYPHCSIGDGHGQYPKVNPNEFWENLDIFPKTP